MDNSDGVQYRTPSRAKMCGLVPLSAATKGIGLLFVVTSIIIGEYTVTYIRKHPAISIVFVYVAACFVILHAAMAILLLIASYKENAPLLLVWMVFELLFTALQGLLVFDLIFVHLEYFTTVESVLNFILVGVQFYAILVVDQFHRQVSWQYTQPGSHIVITERA